ncbi:TetR/AcrR family transcriptional regulator, partial [Escherichia coli]
MPRPKLKSDDEVLEAATVVLKRCGPIEFTLSGVAKEVGLSRAALIQRFTNRDTLLVRMMERGVEQVRHYLNAIPIGAGPQGLWEFLQVLVRSMNTGTVAKLAMRQPFVLFKGLTFQKLCLPGAFRPGDHHNK